MNQKIILAKHKVPEGVGEVRFLDYVIAHIDTVLSRNSAKKAIKNGELLINGKQVETGRYVTPGNIITHIQLKQALKKVYEFDLPVIFEDDTLAIINKPAGLSVSGNYFRTVQNALTYNLKPSLAPDAFVVPVPVHRIDNQTSGLLLIAKTQSAAIHLGHQFEHKKITKTYGALVIGKPDAKGEIDRPIDNKQTISKFELLSTTHSIKYQHISLLKLTPLTGRTHQLRIHLSSIGHPILGDKLYTTKELLYKGKGLFLCAMSIKLQHPLTKKELAFSIDLPHKFKALMQREQKRWNDFNLSNY